MTQSVGLSSTLSLTSGTNPGSPREHSPAGRPSTWSSGHDVMGHGYRWAEVTGMTEEQERDDLEHAMRVLRALVGRPVRGWYVRSFPSERTRRLAAAHPDLVYDSDAVNDELPYRAVLPEASEDRPR
ncbi:MAG TPA: polysaccharide deacetylase family protein [Actinomycetospora sp.]|uniref:polysaccharide deacetylase family protein n=1 Tax=Actinomycetospora sp. TaxID=1872135 RepID=UPI002F425B8E